MATNPSVKPVNRQASTRTQMDVFLGKAEKPLGRLIFVKKATRVFSILLLRGPVKKPVATSRTGIPTSP